MKTETKHTTTPWHYSGTDLLAPENMQESIATGMGPCNSGSDKPVAIAVDHETALFIVRACNEHAALVVVAEAAGRVPNLLTLLKKCIGVELQDASGYSAKQWHESQATTDSTLKQLTEALANLAAVRGNRS